MKYVEPLLRAHLDQHRNELRRLSWLGYHEDVASCLAVISELEYVLELLNNSETYQNY